MTTSMELLLGVGIGLAGFTQMGDNPVVGCGAMFVAGLLLLSGLESLLQLKG